MMSEATPAATAAIAITVMTEIITCFRFALKVAQGYKEFVRHHQVTGYRFQVPGGRRRSHSLLPVP